MPYHVFVIAFMGQALIFYITQNRISSIICKTLNTVGKYYHFPGRLANTVNLVKLVNFNVTWRNNPTAES